MHASHLRVTRTDERTLTGEEMDSPEEMIDEAIATGDRAHAARVLDDQGRALSRRKLRHFEEQVRNMPPASQRSESLL